MRVLPLMLSVLLGMSTIAMMALGAEPGESSELNRIRRHIKPLTCPLGDRLPILTWQSRDFPTGIEDGRVPEVQQLLMDRGISSLCNPTGSPLKAKEYMPVLKYRQDHGFPVCILPQGWIQTHFVSDRRGRSKGPHLPPAESSEEFPCASALRDSRRLERGSALTRDVLTLLREHGVRVTLLVVDFESGAYLRNTGDREEAVRGQAEMAQRCPRCVETFTKDALSTLDGYATVVDGSRAFAIRKMLCDPAREVFPDVRIGNFFAWPINRLPRPEGRWPAYGYEASGMNVAMPRVYMNAGWGGAGSDADKMNWNAFYCCLEGFSPAASVLREGELLIPWVHVWLGGRYLSFVMRGRKLPESWAMGEMACHMMLRGAETFAIWMDNPGEFPADYTYPEYADMGQFVYDVKGVQAGFNEMLQYNTFLRQARPMTFEVPGERSQLGPQTATWSGMATEEKALVRTVSFNHGDSVTKIVEIYGRPIELTFGPKGRNYWVYPDGTIQPTD
ncbi:MAG: hypothetical protein H8E44_06635 [Planctomycetes bacterium]|nr:hypothetical protein [Planctomycetota bacterium]MBL7042303.1 hypothetical protein [Pirellulaceae bacterium]